MYHLSSHQARVLSILGWGIVLATFVIKDAMRERIKDSADVLERTESKYAEIRDHYELIGNFSDMRRTLLAIGNDLKTLRSPTAHFSKLDSIALNRWDHNNRVLDQRLAVLDETIQGLGCNQTDQKVLEDLSDAFSSIQAKYNDDYWAVAGELNERRNQQFTVLEFGGDPKLIQEKPIAQQEAALYQGSAELQPLSDRLLKLERRCTEAAHHNLQLAHDRFEKATTASYVLFGFGWGITLVGRIFSKGKGEDDDSEG